MGSSVVKGRTRGARRVLWVGRGLQSVTEAQAGGHNSEAVAGHYTKASRLDEPLILRNSLLSSLFW